MTTATTSASGRDRLMVLAAAILFSTGGAAVKACSLSGWQVACFRSAVAAVAIFALIPAARRAWNVKTLLVAIAYAATMISFVLANKLTTAANAIFLQGSAPLYVLLRTVNHPGDLRVAVVTDDLQNSIRILIPGNQNGGAASGLAIFDIF